ncbi:MAG: exodeoxyribonuclease VII large subunit [Pseudomonadota bacterium]
MERSSRGGTKTKDSQVSLPFEHERAAPSASSPAPSSSLPATESRASFARKKATEGAIGNPRLPAVDREQIPVRPKTLEQTPAGQAAGQAADLMTGPVTGAAGLMTAPVPATAPATAESNAAHQVESSEGVKPGGRDCPLSVEAVVRAAAALVEGGIGIVWVEGEISGLRIPVSGHAYFVLKDERAQLPAVMWRSSVARLRFRLEEGQRFLVRGKLSVYPEQGKLQIYVEAAEPVGAGAAALALEQLKKRLAAEGLFDPQRKRALPRLPRRIGVVTSPTGAAIRDIVRTIERRFPVPILLSPTRVQGEGAAAEIALALALLGRIPGIDVVIVGRGGGSAEDLSAFNEEVVVRAVVACPVPVISAVGHEIDVTLVDLAADVRAATPTAAGELAVPERDVLLDTLGKLEKQLERELKLGLTIRRGDLEQLAAKIESPRRRVERERQRLDDAILRAATSTRARVAAWHRVLVEQEHRLLALHPQARLTRDRAVVKEMESRMTVAMSRALEQRRQRLENAGARLDALSPLRVLDRGYAIARTISGHVVTSAAAVTPGDPLAVRLANGEIDVEVKAIRSES